MAGEHASFGVVERNDGWVLPLASATVTRIAVDDAVTLECASQSGPLRLVLDTPFVLVRGDTSHRLHAESDPTGLGPVFALLFDVIDSAVVLRTGALEVGFRGGAVLQLDPLPDASSWRLSSPKVDVAIAMPDQALAVFAAGRDGSP